MVQMDRSALLEVRTLLFLGCFKPRRPPDFLLRVTGGSACRCDLSCATHGPWRAYTVATLRPLRHCAVRKRCWILSVSCRVREFGDPCNQLATYFWYTSYGCPPAHCGEHTASKEPAVKTSTHRPHHDGATAQLAHTDEVHKCHHNQPPRTRPRETTTTHSATTTTNTLAHTHQ